MWNIRIQFKDVPNFYGTVGGRNGISEYYMYDATNVRLRELTLGYSFPETLLAKTKFIKGLDLTLVARNLFFLYKDAPFDPDATLSVGNTLQGVDVFGMRLHVILVSTLNLHSNFKTKTL